MSYYQELRAKFLVEIAGRDSEKRSSASRPVIVRLVEIPGRDFQRFTYCLKRLTRREEVVSAK